MKFLSLFRGTAFRGTSRSAVWYLALVVLLPVTSLSVLGMLYLWQNDQLLLVLAAWLAITLAGYAIFILWPRQVRAGARGRVRASPTAPGSRGRSPAGADGSDEVAEQLPDQLHEKPDWTEQDRVVFRQLCSCIETRLTDELTWQRLPEEALELLSAVSSHYHGRARLRGPGTGTGTGTGPGPGPGQDGPARDGTSRLEYRFTLPEALLVLSVASARYRTVVLEHVPFAERVTVASLVTLYDRQRDIRTGYTWFNNIRRTVRLANPVAAAIGELRDQFTNRVFDHLSTNVQRDLKRLLLQEVVQVGIDLYSGKLKSSDDELQRFRSSAYASDLRQKLTAPEPLRIVLAGQISAGKSSLINALADTLHAEVDILPTTDRNVTHSLQLDGAAPMHLIDTIGLAAAAEGLLALVQLAVDADLIMLIVKANQPARSSDRQLWDALQQAFAAMPRRRAPPVMLVMSHIDQLPPRASWSPPYDLSSDNPKALNIARALTSALEQIGLPADLPAVPVCLSAAAGRYNIDAVAAHLMMLQDDATLTQLNRRRVERGEQAISWRERWLQVRRLGLVLGKAAISGGGGSQDR